MRTRLGCPGSQALLAKLLLAGVFSTACADVLGIDDPNPRQGSEADAGASGGGAPASGAGSFPVGGGSAGDSAGPGRAGASAGGTGNAGEAGNALGGMAGAGTGGIAGSPGGSGGIECDVADDACDRADGYLLHSCSSGATKVLECDEYCHANSCAKKPPSCKNDPPCGSGADCCETIWVDGGTFAMADTQTSEATFQRSVSSFFLDRFEVTIERFQAFVAAYELPHANAGAHPRIPNSGWDKSWEDQLIDPMTPASGKVVPQTGKELEAQIAACAGNQYSEQELTLPMNCVNWYAAFAFCVWDGGRLPTEAEWNYAAAHGAEQRYYPWSVSPPSSTEVSCDNAWYMDCALSAPRPVGGRPLGRGGFSRSPHPGHEDLAGNVAEWTLDRFDTAPPPDCSDCLGTWGDDDSDHNRVMRGGSFYSSFAEMRSGDREYVPAAIADQTLGFRCARDSQSGR